MLPNLHEPLARPFAYDVVSGPSLDHRDDVEQLMGQRVAYVTKILDTNEAILTESGRKEREFERVFHSQRESGAVTGRAGQHRERRPRCQR